jgi:hypothetical protein
MTQRFPFALSEADFSSVLYTATAVLIPLVPAFFLSRFSRPSKKSSSLKPFPDSTEIQALEYGRFRIRGRLVFGFGIYVILILFVWWAFPPDTGKAHILPFAVTLLMPLIPVFLLHYFLYRNLRSQSQTTVRFEAVGFRIYSPELEVLGLLVTYAVLILFIRDVFSPQLSTTHPISSSPTSQPSVSASPQPSVTALPQPSVSSSPSPTPKPAPPAWRFDWIFSWHNLALGMPFTAFVVFSLLFIMTVQQGSLPQIESHWGGFGGGLGGWRLSASLTYLVASISMAAIFTVCVLQGSPPTERKEANPALTGPSPGETSGTNGKAESKLKEGH